MPQVLEASSSPAKRRRRDDRPGTSDGDFLLEGDEPEAAELNVTAVAAAEQRAQGRGKQL